MFGNGRQHSIKSTNQLNNQLMSEEHKTPMQELIEWYENHFSEVDFENPRILHKMQDLMEKEKQLLYPVKPVEDVPDVLRKNKPELKALERLVFLKHYKDNHGKNDYYLREQPKAWGEAQAIVAENTMDIDFKIIRSENTETVKPVMQSEVEYDLNYDKLFVNIKNGTWSRRRVFENDQEYIKLNNHPVMQWVKDIKVEFDGPSPISENEEGYIATIEQFHIVETGLIKQLAFDEAIKSLIVLLAYNSGMQPTKLWVDGMADNMKWD